MAKVIDPAGELIKSVLGEEAAKIIDPLHSVYESFDKKKPAAAAAAPATTATLGVGAPVAPAPASTQPTTVARQTTPDTSGMTGARARIRRSSGGRSASILTANLDDARLGG